MEQVEKKREYIKNYMRNKYNDPEYKIIIQNNNKKSYFKKNMIKCHNCNKNAVHVCILRNCKKYICNDCECHKIDGKYICDEHYNKIKNN
jgi:hypothetical protein